MLAPMAELERGVLAREAIAVAIVTHYFAMEVLPLALQAMNRTPRSTIRRRVLASAALALSTSMLAATLHAQQVVVDTRTSGAGPGQLCCVITPFPNPSSAPNGGAFFSVGQLFQVPSPTTLTDFTLWLSPQGGSAQYQAYIVPWDVTNHRLASGTPVWTGGPYTSPTSFNTQTTFTIPGGVGLDPNATYMMFLSTVTPTGTLPQSVGPSWNSGANGFEFQTVEDGSHTSWWFANYPQDAESGGLGTYGSYWNAMTQRSWSDYDFSLEFVAHGDVAQLTTTPEPSSIALIGTGLVGLVPMMRRKRR
jgi:hypothetical protein